MYQPQYLNHPTDEAESALRERVVEKAFDAYGQNLLNYIRRFIADYHLAEDLFQTLWKSVIEDFSIRQITQIGLLKRRLHQLIVDHFSNKVLRNEISLAAPGETVLLKSAFAEPRTDREEERFRETFWDNFKGIQLSDGEKDVLGPPKRRPK